MDDFAHFFDTTSSILGKDQLELFYLICWSLWTSRNDALWNNNGTNLHHIIQRALHFMKEYRQAVLSRGKGATEV